MSPQHRLGLLSADAALVAAFQEVAAQRGISCQTAAQPNDVTRTCGLVVVDQATAETPRVYHDVLLLNGPDKRSLVQVPEGTLSRRLIEGICRCSEALTIQDTPRLEHLALDFPGGAEAVRKYVRQMVARSGCRIDQMLHRAEQGDMVSTKSISMELAPHFGMLGLSALRSLCADVQRGAHDRDPGTVLLIAALRKRWRRVAAVMMQDLQDLR